MLTTGGCVHPYSDSYLLAIIVLLHHSACVGGSIAPIIEILCKLVYK